MYALSVVLVFVTARYRVPIIPIIALPAASGASYLAGIVADRAWRRILVVFLSACIALVLFSTPREFCVEKISKNVEEEIYAFPAWELVKRGQYDRAMEILDRGLGRYPNSSLLYFYLARLEWQRNNKETSLSHYRKAVSLDPNHVDARLELAYALHLDGNLDEASRELKTVLASDPISPGTLVDLSIVERAQGHIQDAYSTLRTAERMYPESEGVLWQLVEILISQEKYCDAEQFLFRAHRLYPDALWVNESLALMYGNSEAGGKEEMAIYYAEQSFARGSGRTDVLLTWARLLRIRNQCERVIGLLREASEQLPGNAAIHKEMARVCLRMNNRDEAGIHGRIALFLDPGDSEFAREFELAMDK
jgi:tetratricopeptide (TPR) repeat protein